MSSSVNNVVTHVVELVGATLTIYSDKLAG